MDAGDRGWRLVLWDVDRTLLHVEGVSRQVYEDAFLAVVGRPLERLADMGGRTDRWIVTETLALHGVLDVDRRLEPFYAELGRAVRDRRALLRSDGRALPGARKALARRTAPSWYSVHARQRAERMYGVPLDWGRVVVVGDTEHDVAGAVDNGAVAVGVTTGGSDAQQLRDAGAAVVLADLTDTEGVVDALLSGAQQHAITCERQRGGRGPGPACGG